MVYRSTGLDTDGEDGRGGEFSHILHICLMSFEVLEGWRMWVEWEEESFTRVGFLANVGPVSGCM